MSPSSGESLYADNAEETSSTEMDPAHGHSKRQRRDSQVGTSYGRDEEASGAIFDGPTSFNFPSSVSSMYHERPLSVRMGRMRNNERCMSGDSVRHSVSRRLSVDSEAIQLEDEGVATDDEGLETQAGAVHHSLSTPQASTSVFDNIASFFGRPPPNTHPYKRTSLSRRGSLYSSRSSLLSSRRSVDREFHNEEDVSEDGWGFASEDEESVASGAPTNASYSSLPVHSRLEDLPMLSRDALFGDTYMDIEDDVAMQLPPPPPGPPSRQSIYSSDEDTTVRFVGYQTIQWKKWTWNLSCVLSLGVLALLGHWFPRLWLRWTTEEKAFTCISAGFVIVETPSGELTVFPISQLEYPYPHNTVFSGRHPVHSNLQEVASPPVDSNINPEALMGHLTFVDYRYVRFALNPRSGLFEMVREWRDSGWTSVDAVRQGLSSATREQHMILFGPNEIDVKERSIGSLLAEEIIHPFYVFQIASIILWSFDDYYYYAFCIAIISAFSVVTTLLETKRTISKMKEMSKFVCPVGVIVDGHWETKESVDLVVGDIINLADPAITMIPADIMLLSGDVIVNESMLTGESVPVSKVTGRDEDIVRWLDGRDAGVEAAKSMLFSGTRIVRARKEAETKTIGLVLRIGFDTTKGSLIRSMLFPKPMGFKFYRDSMRFICVLAGIAGTGFMASAVQFIRLGVTLQTMIVRALDLITVVVPPALPATLSIGTSFSIGRLRQSQIFCISPNRVNVAGKVNVVCFDKTGTLTEEGLDILGVRTPERSGQRFGELIGDARDLPLSSSKASFLYAMATCHSLKLVSGEVVGDPLDVKMFSFTDWTLEEGEVTKKPVKSKETASKGTSEKITNLVQAIVRPPGTTSFRVEDALKSGKRAHFLELGVLKSFEFVSALRRMSVIVKRLKSSSIEVYVKGAPEVMSDICNRESFPQDYDDLLSYYTKRGYRVIAIAGKSIEGLTWLKVQRMKREQAEASLTFLGLVVFENKIKPGTGPAIQKLRAAHLACRMVTGDNPLTAVSVARECGMINPAAHVFYATFAEGSLPTAHSRLEWSSPEDESLKLDDYSLRPLSLQAADSEEMSNHDYTLAITGDIFRWMINYAPVETLQRMLVKAEVFARMSPDEKHEVVERLQTLGYTVAFCGDGANDCGALKAADIGISLSEAEASVAAPFTSHTPDIGCVVEVVKEGRAALVTSFSCFKYMALYSLIQFTTITLLYSFASSLGDFQFLFIDLFMIIPIAVTMGRTLPFDTLHTKRPTANLVSKKVLASIIGQILITSGVQVWSFLWVRDQPWYEPPEQGTANGELETFNYENTVLFLVSCFQYLIVAAVFSIGPPYRKPIWTNGLQMLSMAVLIVLSTVILLAPPRTVALLLDLKYLPPHAKIVLLRGVITNILLSVVFERYLHSLFAHMVGFVFRLRQMACHRGTRIKERKAYKAVEDGLAHPSRL